MAQQFKDIVRETSIADLIESGRPFYSVDSSATVEETLLSLADNKVLSVPVKDAESGEYTDFVDVLDIISFLSTLCKDINSLVRMKVESFTDQAIGEIVNLSNKDPFITVNSSDSASSVHELFAKGVHRVAIKGEDGKVTNVVSQYDFLKFVVKHVNEFSEIADKPIKELGMVQSWVLSVRKTERAVACFKKMVENKVNAVCVVDVVGKFDAQLSSSSLRGLTADTFQTLRLPVEDFLKAQKVPPSNDLSCTGQVTLREVLQLLIDHSTHRLWVVDAAGFPVGIVSITDICKVLNK
mmetsp:Transcript_20526/g.35029  ORF Transcript_20526/g.35029 Transcript_20526/m.35029 type:complete len:296 (-) Transcript_20526:95-982(-)